ncbi:MAG TPA: rhodanese-like domain-containing protein [Gemmatimonadales bacterium]|jgi:hydroxyacylglutathione hydrolase|nr:rhodanese-like domain-containing protein [Gemmatimonadales bacterium]
MLFVRLYDDQLAQASYLIGCGASGTAVVIDPNRRVDQYIAAAEREALRIIAVTETHIHADFVSGTRELAARTGATMYLSACGPPEWRYRFGAERGVILLKDQDSIRVGNVELRAVHTPGHTPEHLSFLVTDTATAAEPMGIATGDFVFVNDVGRPDLLEKAAQLAGTAEAGARKLFHSLAWCKTLPDHLQIWPGHGAGSACGKSMSAVPQSTIGYERRFNWAFGTADEDAFVRQVLAGQPEPPRYFGTMKRINRDGPPVLGALALPERVAEHRIGSLLATGAVIVDLRPAADFAAGHLPGTLNIPWNYSFATWAGSLLPYDRDLYLLLDEAEPGAGRLERVVQSLLMIGLDRVRGYFAADALELWTAEGNALGRVEQLSVGELAGRHNGVMILDVRSGTEWDAGHLEGATHIPLAELPDRLNEVPPGQSVAVHCQGGARSAIAASLLLSQGRRGVANVSGGFGAWVQAGLPVAQ